MKVCFMFANHPDALAVQNFLASSYTVELGNCLGYTTLSVPRKDAPQALAIGSDYIRATHIHYVWWINGHGQRLPIDEVTLIFGEIPNFYKCCRLTRNIAELLCNRYAKRFEKHLGVEISWLYTSCKNIEFRIICCDSAIKNHKVYEQKITEYCLRHHHMFEYMIIKGLDGNSITMINKNRTIEWQAKRPH